MSKLRWENFSQTKISSHQRNSSHLNHVFSLELKFESSELVRKIKSCVFIELNKSYERRSKAKLFVVENKLCLKIQAADLFALRATVRSLLQSIALTYSVIKNFD